MIKPFEHFFICIFAFTAFFLVFINFLIWSGSMPSGDSISENQYFGFYSLLNMLTDWGNQFKLFGSDKITFAEALTNLVNYSLFNMPNFVTALNTLVNEGITLNNVLTILKEIVIMLATPLVVFAYSIFCLAWLIVIVVSFLVTSILAMGGQYNVVWGSNPPLNPNDYISRAVVHWQNDVAPLFTAWGYKGAHITIPLM